MMLVFFIILGNYLLVMPVMYYTLSIEEPAKFLVIKYAV